MSPPATYQLFLLPKSDFFDPIFWSFSEKPGYTPCPKIGVMTLFSLILCIIDLITLIFKWKEFLKWRLRAEFSTIETTFIRGYYNMQQISLEEKFAITIGRHKIVQIILNNKLKRVFHFSSFHSIWCNTKIL